MKKIGLLSDTHAYLHKRIFPFFDSCDQIWHAGDFGSMKVAEELSSFKPLVGVYGNIDGYELRKTFPLDQQFRVESLNVWLTHIGGYPGRYEKRIKEQLDKKPPGLFVCGHSHILKVIYDKKYNMLHINPGAAGKYGFHNVITAIRFDINKDRIENLEVLELPK